MAIRGKQLRNKFKRRVNQKLEDMNIEKYQFGFRPGRYF